MLRFFFTMLASRIRSLLRSPVFWLISCFFVAASVLFGALLPSGNQNALRVGLIVESAPGLEAQKLLLENEDYTFVVYEGKTELERNVLTGKLHCGYILGGGSKPIALLTTKGSFLAPLTNEIVLAAWSRVQTPNRVQEFLDSYQIEGDAPTLVEEKRQTSAPVEVELRLVGGGQLAEREQPKTQLLAYAVLICAFLAASLLAAMLTDPDEHRALSHLAAFSGHRTAVWAANAIAWAVMNFVVLLLADGLLSQLLGEFAYPLVQRLPMLFSLAVCTLVVALLGGRLHRRSMLVSILLPPWLLVSVLCSGALIDPAMLPGGLSLLRFLSPAWYLLRLL